MTRKEKKSTENLSIAALGIWFKTYQSNMSVDWRIFVSNCHIKYAWIIAYYDNCVYSFLLL